MNAEVPLTHMLLTWHTRAHSGIASYLHEYGHHSLQIGGNRREWSLLRDHYRSLGVHSCMIELLHVNTTPSQYVTTTDGIDSFMRKCHRISLRLERGGGTYL